MTDTTLRAPDPDARAKRNVIVLVIAQALLGAQMPINFILGGLAGQLLASNKALATLPISLIVITSMITAPLISNFMGKYGRRAGFLVGVAGGAASGLICAYAMFVESFTLLLIGACGGGVYMSAQAFYRFAAAETASPEFKPKAISWTLAGGLAAAVIGPEVVVRFSDALAPVPFAGAYLGITVLCLIGAPVFYFLDIPRPKPRVKGAPSGRPLKEILAQPRVIVAIICAMVAYSLMNLVMTSTPLAVVFCGYSSDIAADVVRWHVLAMFAPSFFTGNLIARFGHEKIIWAGMIMLAACGAVAVAGIELSNFYIALVLLGFGWNFGFIGATSMLAASHTAEEQSKVQGLNDFLVFGMVSVASLSSGALMASVGWSAVNFAMAPFLALATGALLWLWARRD